MNYINAQLLIELFKFFVQNLKKNLASFEKLKRNVMLALPQKKALLCRILDVSVAIRSAPLHLLLLNLHGSLCMLCLFIFWIALWIGFIIDLIILSDLNAQKKNLYLVCFPICYLFISF
jgi:hypothetical protein